MEKHDTLLVSSASAEHRAHLREVLGERFNLLDAEHISQMLLLLRQNIGCIAALVLDISQQEEIEHPILKKQENTALLRRIPVIVISKDDNPLTLNRAFGMGAADVIPIGYDPYAMLHRIENIVDLHLHKQYLETMVQEQAMELRQASNAMVDALSSIIEYRSVESGQHILRIRHFTKILLEEVVRCCPEYGLTEEMISVICSASALHDIGKIAIPDSVLLKPEMLTEEERELMKTHTITGCHILNTLGDVAEEEYLRYAHNICHYHHERWDGGGYPEGLSGDDIPICAQVVGLADVYDALITKRAYKDTYSCAQAANMILKGECGVFSPKLVECFKHVTRQFEDLALDYADGLSPKTEVFDAALPIPQNEYTENSLEYIRGKYYALVHYINGFLLELNLKEGLFHVVYNPYPELARLQGINTFQDMERMILEEVVHPTDRQRMERMIREGIGEFLDKGLRRQSDWFRFCSDENPEGDLFEVAFLRINPADTKRCTLAVMVRRVDAVKNVVRELSDHILTDAVYSCRNDRDFTLLKVHGNVNTLGGYTLEEITNHFGGGLIGLVHPEDREMVRREFHEQLKRGAEVKLEFRLLRKDGTVSWVLDKSRLITDGHGGEYLLSAITDITHFKRDNERLLDQLERYEIILAQTENVLFEWDMSTDKVDYSNTWEKIFGFAPIRDRMRANLVGGTHFHPDDLPLVLDSIGNIENGSAYEMVEARIATAKGRYLWCRLRATALRDAEGNLVKIAGVIINIDAEKQEARALQDRAERDSLTKLLNKDAGRRQAQEYFSRFPEGMNSALMIIDLDDFKLVNDRYGHLFGDSVLTKAAREIKKLFRNQDIVARIGGDEFMVVMRGISDAALLRQRSQQLLQTFRNILQNFRHKLPLSCSIGIALSPLHGKSYIELFRNADLALYRAKARGKNCFEIYNPDDAQYLSHPGRTTAVSTPIDSDTDVGIANDSIVRYALQKLNSSQDVASAINDILCLMGEKMNVSRVYVFENSEDNRFCYNTYEWCNQGIHPEIDNLQSISYESDIPGYEQNFNEHGIFYCPDVTILPKQIYDILAPQGIKSMLQCAIRENGVFRGYIGFDECREQRLWTKEQIRLLSFLSETISVFLLQLRRQKKSQKQADTLRSILENQDAWIYIVEPDTFRLLYTNAKLSRICAVQPGIPCYQTLRGLTQPCSDCPVVCATSSIQSCPWLDCPVLTDVSRIRWEGKDAFLITAKALSDTIISEFSKKNSQKVKSEMESEIPV